MGGTGGTSRVIEDDGPWSELACRRLISLAYVSLVVGVLAAMGLQVCAAFCVRDYARGLFEGERGLGVEAGLEAGERPGDEKTTEGKEHRPFIVLDAPLGMEGEV
ncbi:hypothetical protein DSL72_009411 [Monilinia vaccinii-corymbosi]|uniref:Uncharacterized protein n=1 Tax=Monilinia vaccinii-corymbosi TaxID=61207 RepID=A0A8A3PP94_9HELO|nr:hypothetical protein DSL72_009411 [Monilinia vaccinii-corymbosi]